MANILLETGMIVIFAILAIGNLRRGRGDQKGALRLAILCFVATALARLFRADHVFSRDEFNVMQIVLAWSAYRAAVVWLGYLALEPYVRRRWPHTLIAWSRLLSGRVTDPLVGRDILAGIIGGVALVGLAHLLRLVPAWIGMPMPAPVQFATSSLGSVRHVAYFVLQSISEYVIAALTVTAGVVVMRSIVRSQAIAVAVVFLVLAAAFLGNASDSVTLLIMYAALSAGVLLFVMMRFGLLALAVTGIVFGWLRLIPLTLDSSAWYAGRSFFLIGLLAALSIGAFFVVLAGKPLFGKALLEE
jgi:serine/threonine-protein kinase